MHSLKILAMATAAVLATGTARADVISVTRDDIGKEFVIDYDGRRGDGTIDDTAKAVVVLKLTKASENSYSFAFAVSNRMLGDGDQHDGRLAGFGFNTNPGLVGAASNSQYFGIARLGSNVPNVGIADVCFTGWSVPAQPGCAVGGINAGDGAGGLATLTFGSALSSIQLSDFFVLYRGGVGGASFGLGTARGGTPVPEPADLALFAIGAAGLMIGRRRATRARRAA